jgi:hypothetical protein
MKQLSLILIYLSVFNCVNFGQNTTYLDSVGNILKTKEKAEYFKIEKEDGDNIKNVSEFYISGNKKASYNLIVKSDRNKKNGLLMENISNGIQMVFYTKKLIT